MAGDSIIKSEDPSWLVVEFGTRKLKTTLQCCMPDAAKLSHGESSEQIGLNSLNSDAKLTDT